MKPYKLPVLNIILNTFIFIWWKRRALSKAVALPALSLILLNSAVHIRGAALSQPAFWLVYLSNLFLFCLLAIACHRFVLLAIPSAPSERFRWTRRESRFIIFFIVFTALYVFVSIFMTTLLGTVAGNIISPGPSEGPAAAEPERWFIWVNYFSVIIGYYFLSRMSLIFPATAIDHKVGLRWALSSSSYNGWRLFIIVGVMPKALSFVLGKFFRHNASAPEVVIISLLAVIVIIVGVVALSLCFKELSEKGGVVLPAEGEEVHNL